MLKVSGNYWMSIKKEWIANFNSLYKKSSMMKPSKIKHTSSPKYTANKIQSGYALNTYKIINNTKRESNNTLKGNRKISNQSICQIIWISTKKERIVLIVLTAYFKGRTKEWWG